MALNQRANMDCSLSTMGSRGGFGIAFVGELRPHQCIIAFRRNATRVLRPTFAWVAPRGRSGCRVGTSEPGETARRFALDERFQTFAQHRGALASPERRAGRGEQIVVDCDRGPHGDASQGKDEAVYGRERQRMHVLIRRSLCFAVLLPFMSAAFAQVTQKVVDIPTRPGVTQRLLVLAPPAPKAAVVLFAGGHGGLQLGADGSIGWGRGNFLVRTRQQFAEQGLLVVLLDAASDRQSPPYLSGFRQRPEHAADVKAVIAWLRAEAKVPVWLVGTSRGTQSVGYVATELTGSDGPDGVVLTSTIVRDDKGRAVAAMPVEKIRIPVLVVHHEQDGCALCLYAEVPVLMRKLGGAPRSQLLAFKGGENRGDPCEAMAYHGFNGLEGDVVPQIAAWIVAK